MLTRKRVLTAVIAISATAIVLIACYCAPYDASRVAVAAYDVAIGRLESSAKVRAVCLGLISDQAGGPRYREAGVAVFSQVARRSRIKVYPLSACGPDRPIGRETEVVPEFVVITATGEQAGIAWIARQTPKSVSVGFYRGFTFAASWDCSARAWFGRWRVGRCKATSQS
jgi:hypothetical protein